MILCIILASKMFKGSGPDGIRAGIQYQKISMNQMPNGNASHPLTSDAAKLRQAFNDSSEEEV